MKLHLSLCMTFLVIVSVFPFSAEAVWNIQTVDSTGNVGNYTSIAIDLSGNPHISYEDRTNGALKYANWTGSAWGTQTVVSTVFTVEYISMALDSSDNPHISYYDVWFEDLNYAKRTGGIWSNQTVDSAGPVGRYSSLAIDSSDNPHISYFDLPNTALNYAKWTGSTWDIGIVDLPGTVGYFTSIALDSFDKPHISYYDTTNGNLKYANWTGSMWINQTVDSTGNAGYDTSIAIDSTGNPHISYYDVTNGDLKYAKWSGGTWNIQTVDSTGNVGWHTSIAIDLSGDPHISYYDAINGDLKYAKWTGSSWSIQTVDSAGDVGHDTSIAIDPSGNPHISYEDETNSDLKYATLSSTIDSCRAISSPGEYVLNQNIINSVSMACISIDSKDVILDGAGYIIDGINSSGSYGVWVKNSNNVTVKNLDVTDWDFGIIYEKSGNGYIINNTVSSINTTGILIWDSSNNAIIANNIVSNTEFGINILTSDNITVTNNIASGNRWYAVRFWNSFNSDITDNDVSGNDDWGIALYDSSNNNIIDNIASDNYVGIRLNSSNGNSITGNIANLNNFSGIYLTSSSDNMLSNNNANSNINYGVHLDKSSNNNVLTNNNANLNIVGIYLSSSSNNNLTDTTALSNNNMDFVSEYDSLNNNVLDLNINHTISFTGKDVGIKWEGSPPASDPPGYTNINKYINAKNYSPDSWLFLNVSYSDGDVSGMDENTLRMWKHNGSWAQVSGTNGVDVVQNFVYANITSFGIFAPMIQKNILYFPPPAPVNLANTTGYFWVNHTWQAGSGGNTTDSYNVSVNGTWINGTINTYYYNSVGPNGWSNITVYAYNNSGSLSLTSVSDNTQAPNVNSTIFINITSPANNSIHKTGYVNVNVTLSRPGTATLNWEGNNESMLPPGTGTSFYKNKTRLNLSGNYTFKVYANDSGGIYNVSETRTITIDRSETILLPTDYTTGNISQDVMEVAPSGNVTIMIYNGTNVTLNKKTQPYIIINSIKQVNFTLSPDEIFAMENYTVLPNDTHFIHDAQVRFNYTDAQLAAIGASESDLLVRIYKHSGVERDLPVFEHNKTGNYLIVNLSDLCFLSLIAKIPGITPFRENTISTSGNGGTSTEEVLIKGENYTNIDITEKYEMDIYKDKFTFCEFTHTRNPVKFINITGNANTGEITAAVEVLKNTSSQVEIPAPGRVYANINIRVGKTGFAVPKNIKEASIKFMVKRAWVNDLEDSDVGLVRWDGSKWVQLETVLMSEDEKDAYYEAKTDYFSPFAITSVRTTGGPVAGGPPELIATPVQAETLVPVEEVTGFGIALVITAFSVVLIVRRKWR